MIVPVVSRSPLQPIAIGLFSMLLALGGVACQSQVSAPGDAALDEALARFGEPLTAERRAEARELLSSLAADASEAGGCDDCSELAILERMLELPPTGELTFDQAAQFAFLDLTRDRLYEERS